MDDAELRAQLECSHPENYGWALSCCARNRDEAEEVLQIVYLKILAGQARFDGRATLKTWLFSVIRRTAIDERRRRIVRRLGLMSHEESVARVAQEEAADAAIERSQIQALFCRALGTLPRRQREVLQLVFYHDLSLQEAADAMDVSIGSARTHYDRGKKRLRDSMEALGVCDEPGLERTKTEPTLP
jgi:RNA polymerase sigma-70 factor (ECF subfamily)